MLKMKPHYSKEHAIDIKYIKLYEKEKLIKKIVKLKTK